VSGTATSAAASAARTIIVVEGSGHSTIGGQLFDWEDKDVFTVPTWIFQ
jgi:gentisate 1,2-dioxygenase